MSTVALILSLSWLAWRAARWLAEEWAPEPPPVRQHRAVCRALGEAVNRCKH